MRKVLIWNDDHLHVKHWVEQDASGNLILFREVDLSHWSEEGSALENKLQSEMIKKLEREWINNENIGNSTSGVAEEMYESCDTIKYCEEWLYNKLLKEEIVKDNDFLITSLEEYKEERLAYNIDMVLTKCKMDRYVIYRTPKGSIRCFDLEENKTTLRDDNNRLLYDFKLLDYLKELVPTEPQDFFWEYIL